MFDKNRYPYSEGKDKGKQNLYKVFIELAYNLAHENSIISLITQSSIMCDVSSQFTRELLLTKTNLNYFIEFKEKEKIFTGVTQGVCIIEFQKRIPSKENIFKISINNSQANMNKIEFEEIVQNKILEFFPLYEFPLIKKGYMKIVEKLKTNKILLKEFLKDSLQGNINTIHLKTIKSDKETGYKICKGENIKKFGFQGKFMDCIISDKTTKMVERNKEFNLIVMQGIAGTMLKNRIIATLIDKSKNTNNFVFLHSTKILFVECNKTAKLLTGILNSKAIDWLFRITSTNNNVNIYEIENFPIPKITDENKNLADKIINLVDEILKAKEQNKDTSGLENQIDEIVYKIYNLTDDEKSLIKGENL